MADISILQSAGAPATKQTKFAPFGTKRLFSGLYTYRNPLAEPGTRADSRYYGGRPDVLCDGENIEVSNKNTLIRRPGYSPYTTGTFDSPVIGLYSYQQLDQSMQMVGDSASTVYSITPTSTTQLYAKSAGAGRVSYHSVGSWLYMSDGVSLNKWNGSTFEKWGIAPPSSAPSMTFATGTASTTSTYGWSYVYCYQNSTTKHISTASPVSAYTGKKSSFTVTLQGVGSSDPQVSNIQIYRTNDGGATYYLLATIANTASWTWTDSSTSDTPLNTSIIAPQAMANEPPPTGLTNLAYFSGRMWGSVDNYVFYASGADADNGGPNECWPPLNYFMFPSRITALIPYTNGLFVFTPNNLYVIQGNVSATGAAAEAAAGYSTGTIFYDSLYLAGLGVQSSNAVDSYSSVIYAFTTDRQLIALNPGSGVQCLSAGVTDLMESIDPTKASVACLSQGYADQAVFLCDGDGHVWRCNGNQQPEGVVAWSPIATIASGASLCECVETLAGTHNLIVASGSTLLKRDWTTRTDNGTPFKAFVTIGSIVLTEPGQLAEVQSVTTECKAVGSAPGIAILANEIEGTYIPLVLPVPDPPTLPPSSSIYSTRNYISQTPLPSVMRHLRIQISLPAEDAASEMYGYSLYGAVHPE